MVFDILNVLNVWSVFSRYLLISNDAYISQLMIGKMALNIIRKE